jgi:NAD-dependent deacetylase
MSSTLLDTVATYLKSAQQVVALTGGGVSSEARFPSFREAHSGDWSRYDVSELATPQAFLRNPRLVWEWYAHRRKSAEQLAPGATHQALVALERRYPGFTLITQTIDGLHVRAGSQNVVELNGCLSRTRCYEAAHLVNDWEDVGEVPPRCPHCGSILRPDVVMFGEGLPQGDLRRARQAVEQCDLLLCLGTIGAIEPVSSFPFAARRAHARVIAIAPEDSIYSLLADDVIVARPGDVLPELVRAVVGE